MARKRRDHIAYTRGMAGAAMKGRSAARRCLKCGLAIIRYPGRYPTKCPTCGGEIEMVESVISCTSQVPRLQQVIDGGTRAGRPCVYSSNSFIVPYEHVTRAVPEGVHGLTAFLEGPVQGRYYRVENPGDPVIILELDDTLNRARLFATENPTEYLGADPRKEFVEATITEARPKDGGKRHKSGDRQTTPYDGFRFSVGHNKTRKPRRDMMRAMQNRRNARRGLAKRTKASKEWHRSSDGERLHKALGRYNHDNNKKRRMAESILARWQPNPALLEAATEYIETIDDVLDAVMRKLLVVEALDVLQDVEFDDASGSIYLFFSPMLEGHEVNYIAQLLQAEHNGLQIVASPNGELPNEQAPADWWVLYIPRSKNEATQPPGPDPRFYSTAYPDGPPAPGEEPPPQMLKQQMVVQAPMSSAEQIAQDVNIDQALNAIGAQESLSTLPTSLAEKIARKFGAIIAEGKPTKATLDKAVRAWQLFNGLAALGGTTRTSDYNRLLGRAQRQTQKIAGAMGQPFPVIQQALQNEAEKRGHIIPQLGKDL